MLPREATIIDLLFADDAAITSHTQKDLQRLMENFANACKLFSLTISLTKTQVMGKATSMPPTITIAGENMAVVNQFQYQGATTRETL